MFANKNNNNKSTNKLEIILTQLHLFPSAAADHADKDFCYLPHPYKYSFCDKKETLVNTLYV